MLPKNSLSKKPNRKGKNAALRHWAITSSHSRVICALVLKLKHFSSMQFHHARRRQIGPCLDHGKKAAPSLKGIQASFPVQQESMRKTGGRPRQYSGKNNLTFYVLLLKHSPSKKLLPKKVIPMPTEPTNDLVVENTNIYSLDHCLKCLSALKLGERCFIAVSLRQAAGDEGETRNQG